MGSCSRISLHWCLEITSMLSLHEIAVVSNVCYIRMCTDGKMTNATCPKHFVLAMGVLNIGDCIPFIFPWKGNCLLLIFLLRWLFIKLGVEPFYIFLPGLGSKFHIIFALRSKQNFLIQKKPGTALAQLHSLCHISKVYCIKINYQRKK